MPIALFRIDDRLIHGQVVVGWGQPLGLSYIVLVDDNVAESDWEQELYRMGVPPGVTVHFVSVAAAASELDRLEQESGTGILVVSDIDSMRRLVGLASGRITRVNVGGVHHTTGRTGRLRYVYLTAQEEAALREIAAAGVEVSAQDVPASKPVPLNELLASVLGG